MTDITSDHVRLSRSTYNRIRFNPLSETPSLRSEPVGLRHPPSALPSGNIVWPSILFDISPLRVTSFRKAVPEFEPIAPQSTKDPTLIPWADVPWRRLATGLPPSTFVREGVRSISKQEGVLCHQSSPLEVTRQYPAMTTPPSLDDGEGAFNCLAVST